MAPTNNANFSMINIRIYWNESITITPITKHYHDLLESANISINISSND